MTLRRNKVPIRLPRCQSTRRITHGLLKRSYSGSDTNNTIHWLPEGLLPDFDTLLDPDELAGLACETGINAELLVQREGSLEREVYEGPFAEHEFDTLPLSHWSLRVFGVDRHIPAAANAMHSLCIAAGLKLYSVDTVEAVYTEAAGGPGAMIWQAGAIVYQLQGSQRVSVYLNDKSSAECDASCEIGSIQLSAGEAVHINAAHMLQMQAESTSLVLIVRLWAPQYGDMFESLLNTSLLAAHPATEERHQFATKNASLDGFTAGVLDDADISKVQAQLSKLFHDHAFLSEWLASFMTVPHGDAALQPAENEVTWEELVEMINDAGCIARMESSRLLYAPSQEDQEQHSAFGKFAINGQVHDCRYDLKRCNLAPPFFLS